MSIEKPTSDLSTDNDLKRYRANVLSEQESTVKQMTPGMSEFTTDTVICGEFSVLSFSEPLQVIRVIIANCW